MLPGVQRASEEPRKVEAPMTRQSAHARRSPMTKRSRSLLSLISLVEAGTLGIATTPSSVETKFAKSRGCGKPREPP